ncbi:hypothetical protein QJS66_00505 [Kocuria rhizophila]|nr:hypothetical protein QJS66_00505 [Kocuria rhizophila]
MVASRARTGDRRLLDRGAPRNRDPLLVAYLLHLSGSGAGPGLMWCEQRPAVRRSTRSSWTRASGPSMSRPSNRSSRLWTGCAATAA